MRKKLIILGFALATAAASTLTSSADGPATGACAPGYYRVVCVTNPAKSICCPDYAMCAC